jgi:hypothetical protein
MGGGQWGNAFTAGHSCGVERQLGNVNAFEALARMLELWRGRADVMCGTGMGDAGCDSCVIPLRTFMVCLLAFCFPVAAQLLVLVARLLAAAG